jgi:hypothetical protein
MSPLITYQSSKHTGGLYEDSDWIQRREGFDACII